MDVWLLLVHAAIAADCPTPTDDSAVQDALVRAEKAYVDFDLESFANEVATARTSVECLAEPIAPATAAAVHRWIGLEAFGRRDLAAAELHFGTARALAPDFQFDESVVPTGSPIFQHYLIREPDPSARTDLAIPADGVSLWVDGNSASSIATDLPHIFQITEQGSTRTQFLASGAGLPTYPLPPVSKAKPRRTGWFVAAGVLGASALAMQGAGFARRNAIVNDTDRDPSERFDALKPNAALFNGLTVGLGVAGGGALGVGLLR